MPRSFTVLAALAGVGVLVAIAVIGLITLWPHDRTVDRPAGLTRLKTERAEIVVVARTACRTPVRATAGGSTPSSRAGRTRASGHS